MGILIILFLSAEAGFLQLTDRQIAVHLDGSQTEGAGYIRLKGSDSQFAGHAFLSETYTITLWALEKQATTTNQAIVQLQQGNISVQSGSPGAEIPSIHKTTTDVTGCVDTTTQTSHCKSINSVPGTLWTWTYYFISVCKQNAELRLCYVPWRGQPEWVDEPITGDVFKFDQDSIAYLGGSPYAPGINGKIADVRYYDTSCYSLTEAESLGLNRRCASPCVSSCWGPDEASCSGLEFLHPYYSTYLDQSNTQNVGMLTFPGTDVKFKGHQLESQEMSASVWVYSETLDNTQWMQVMRFRTSCCTNTSVVGDRILTAFIKPNDLHARTSLDNDADFGCNLVTATSMENEWVHIGMSISQRTREFICCATIWGQPINCETSKHEANVHAFTTAGDLYIGADMTAHNSIGGRVVDFKFFNTQALTISDFEEIVEKAPHHWAPSCHGSCWGPDTWSCNDYIQVTDPRFSDDFTTSADIKTYLGSDPRTSKYSTWNGTNFSLAAWVYRDATYANLNLWEEVVRVYDNYVNCCAQGSRNPALFLHQGNYMRATVTDASNTGTNYAESAVVFVGDWVHVTQGVSANLNTICVTQFDLAGPTTQCASTAITNTIIQWDPTVAGASIVVGDAALNSWQFVGKTLDVRYYPNKTLLQADAEAISKDELTCVGDTEDCTGPDHLSVRQIYLTEKNYEYTTYKTGGEGYEYFYIPGTHPNWLKNPFASNSYQLSIWILGEDRLVPTTNLNRLQTHTGESGAPGQGRKIPATHLHGGKMHSWVDTDTTSDNCDGYSVPDYPQVFKQYFNTWASTCNVGSIHYNCYTEWGSAAVCQNSSISGIPLPFTSAGWAYFGGDDYIYQSYLRATNYIYYPQECYDDTTIINKVAALVCDVTCDGSCYGPGIHSCIYDEPLYISDEWEPYVNDGTATWVTKRGFEEEFEGRFMAYSDYTVCTWFYLNNPVGAGNTLHLVAMTSTWQDVSSTYRCRAPRLSISGTSLTASVVDQNDNSFDATVTGVIISSWQIAWAAVSQDASAISVKLGNFQNNSGAMTSQDTAFVGSDASYFDTNGYLYYGGIQAAGEVSIDGQMLDIRFWDTLALSDLDVQGLITNKGCHGRCTSWTGPTAEFCSACQLPYLLHGTTCVTTCPAGTWNDGINCQTWDSFCSQCTAAGPNAWTQCHNPYYRENTSCLVSCSNQFYESAVNNPDYQCLPCHEGCEQCTGPNNNECSTCNAGWYFQATVATTCLQTCGTGQYLDDVNNTCSLCATVCATWYGSPTHCLTCNTGYLMYGTFTCLNSCPTDYYWADTSDQTCKACDISCKRCIGSTNADWSHCRDGYYLEQPSVSPGTCVSICPTSFYYDDVDNECDNCHNYWVDCYEKLSTDCTKWQTPGYFLQPQPNENTCATTCPTGYWQNANSGDPICTKCHFSCTTCTAGGGGSTNTDCDSWAFGYYSDSGACEVECQTGFWASATTQTCDVCHVNCTECFGSLNSEWTACATGYFMQPPASTSFSCDNVCPDGWYQGTPDCEICEDICSKCTGPDNTGLCTECKAGYFLDAATSICSTWHAACETCNDGTDIQCITCNYGYFLKNGRICEDHCGPTFWRDWSDATCKDCDLAVSKCTDWEVAADICTTCADKYYIGKGFSANNCLSCNNLCYNCTGPGNTECTACDTTIDPNLILIDGSCICGEGYYFETSSSCGACHGACLQCDVGIRLCTQWPFGKYGQDCHCVDTQYETADFTCEDWYHTCASWDGPDANNCLTCKQLTTSGSVFRQPDGTCAETTCPDGTFPNTTTYVCDLCDETCTRCFKGGSQGCTSCDEISRYYENNQWKWCGQGFLVENRGCKEICGDGQHLEQFEWDDGNNDSNDGCSNICTIEPGYTCLVSHYGDKSRCSDTTPPEPKLQKLSNPNQLSLQFSETLSEPINKQQMDLKIGQLSDSDFTWEIVSYSQDYTQYTLQFELNANLYRKTWAACVFNNQYPVKDTSNNQMTTKEVSIDLQLDLVTVEANEEDDEIAERRDQAFEIFGSVIGYTTIVLLGVTLTISFVLKIT